MRGRLLRYRVFCVTEGRYVEASRAGEPTRCPNDYRHEVDPSLTEALGPAQSDPACGEVAASPGAGSPSRDAAGRLRVSSAQSLLGSDFAYGMGRGEWETLELVNNLPTSYYRYGDPRLPVRSMLATRGSREVGVACSSPHLMTSGDALIVAGARGGWANGAFVVRVRGPDAFSYSAKETSAESGELFLPGATDVYRGRYYQGASLRVEDIRSDEAERSTLTVATAGAHGFSQGALFNLTNTASAMEVRFDAEDVEHGAFVSYQREVDCGAGSPEHPDFSYYPVTASGWAGARSVFFDASAVAAGAPGEVEPLGGALDDGEVVMYVCPEWEAAVGGLEPWALYLAGPGGLGPLAPGTEPGVSERVYGKQMDVFGDFSSASHTVDWAPGISGTGVRPAGTREYSGVYVAPSAGEVVFELMAERADVALWFGVAGALGERNVTATCRSTSRHRPEHAEVRLEVGAGELRPFTVRVSYGNKGGFRVLASGCDGEGCFRRVPPGGGLAAGAAAAFSGPGTGVQALVRAHPVVSVDPAADRVTVDRVGRAYSLESGQTVAVFSRWGTGVGGVVSSSGAALRTYTLRDVRVTNDRVDFYLSDSNSAAKVRLSGSAPDGVAWVVPTRPLPERDTVRVPGHAFREGEVAYEVASGTGPEGLVHGESYELRRHGESRVSFERGGATVRLASPGSGVVRLSQVQREGEGDRLRAPGHHLGEGDAVTYCNLGNPNVPGLSDGTEYVVGAYTDELLELRDAAGGEVDLTGPGSGTHALRVARGSADGRHEVTRVPDESTLSIRTAATHAYRSWSFLGGEAVLPSEGALYLPSHGAVTGAAVSYRALGGGGSLGGLEDGGRYWSVRVDSSRLALAATREAALAGQPLPLTGEGAEGRHQLRYESLLWYAEVEGGVSLAEGSREVACAGCAVSFQYRAGDEVLLEAGGPEELEVSSVDAPSGVLLLPGASGLADGDWLRYGALGGGGLRAGWIYYARRAAGGGFSLHGSREGALAGSGAVVLSGEHPGDYDRFTRHPPAVVHATRAAGLGSGAMQVEHASPVTAAAARLYRRSAVLPSSEGVVTHRAVDAGIDMRSSLQPNTVFCRQTKMHFSYQSGKGMSASMSVNFNPPIDVARMSRTGAVATVETSARHNLRAPGEVRVSSGSSGSSGSSSGWEGLFPVVWTDGGRLLRLDLSGLARLPDEEVAAGHYALHVATWSECNVRVGAFDHQNGMFVEYDGGGLWAVRRSSVRQIPGSARVARGSPVVLGDGTAFSAVLRPRDMVVIKGQSYRVSKVASDGVLHVQPPYRGADASGAAVTLTAEARVPRREFNLDRLDGTGPSGYVLDPTKSQMVVVDYSWYGVGAARVGFKGRRGEVFYAHEFIHNNVLEENYTRTGSLPVRFEIATGDRPSYVPGIVHWGVAAVIDGGYDVTPHVPLSCPSETFSFAGCDEVAFVADTTASSQPERVPGGFAYGYRAAVDPANYELVRRLRPGTPVRGGGAAGGTRTVGSAAKTAGGGRVWLSLPPDTPSTAASLTAGDGEGTVPPLINLLSVRVAPSADNDRSGPLGVRETVNRRMIVLREVRVHTTHDVDVDVVLSGSAPPGGFAALGGTSLAEVQRHAAGEAVDDGMVIFTMKAFGGGESMRASGVALSDALPMTNSVMGGDGVFPDGPEVATLRVRPADLSGVSVDSPFRVQGSLGWVEK